MARESSGAVKEHPGTFLMNHVLHIEVEVIKAGKVHKVSDFFIVIVLIYRDLKEAVDVAMECRDLMSRRTEG